MRLAPALAVVCVSSLAWGGKPRAAEPVCWNLRSCKASCAANQREGCRLLAERYAQGKGQIPISYPKAATWYEKGCGLGDLAACTALAELLFKGKPGLPRNVARAVALHEVACNKGQGDSCVTVGHLYLTGASVPKDLGLARQRYEQACRRGTREGCDSLALVDVTRETRGATSHLQSACSEGQAWACNVLRQIGSAP